MMTAIDYGGYAIRSAFRNPTDPKAVTFLSERSEYAVLPMLDSFRDAIGRLGISYAKCEDSYVVFGNKADQVRWLSRKPCAPLFADGHVPTTDAPARQILNILTQSMLPSHSSRDSQCCFTTSGVRNDPRNVEFLSRLIRMHGFAPMFCSPTEATMLACGSVNNFTGVAVCMGTDITEVSLFRYGSEIVAETLDVGSNWVDIEMAKQLQMKVWDDTGNCYLDLAAVREWKHDRSVHLRNSTGERERTLSRLYGVILSRVARTIRQFVSSESVEKSIGKSPLAVICAGGPTQIGGFANAMTERLVEQDTASRIQSVSVVENPSLAVVRGLLIFGELESRRGRTVEFAA